jgi:hypothetical protein
MEGHRPSPKLAKLGDPIRAIVRAEIQESCKEKKIAHPVCSSGVVVGDGCFTTSSNASSDWGLQPYSVTAIDPHNKSPYLHQFHFGLELQAASEAALELAYVGSAGHRLPLLRDLSLCNAAKSLVDPLNCFNQNDILDQDNVGNSNFNSLQVRFETRNFHGLQLRTFYQ